MVASPPSPHRGEGKGKGRQLRFEIWNLFGICSLGFEIDHFGKERTISPIGKNMVK
jgi:hypothetical protein